MEDGEPQQQRADRLQSIGLGRAQRQEIERPFSERYSRFVKFVSVILPLGALGLILVLMSGYQMEDIVPKPLEAEVSSVRSSGKNELLAPRFESSDDQGNPYVVTAKRALQGQSAEDDLIILEEPIADIALEDGAWLAVKAAQSAFRQESQRLLLKGNVEIFHDEGYTLSTSEMDVDMRGGTARVDVDVNIQGPKGVLDAKGLEADRNAGLLVFKGPAKLVLSEGL